MDTNTLSTITNLTVEGKSTREIGETVGLSHVTIAYHQKKPDIKALVEKGISQLLQRGLTPSINTHCRLAAIGASVKMVQITDPDTGRTYKTTNLDPQILKLSLEASKNILQHANGSGPQTVINQLIYSQGTHTSVDAHSLQLVNRALGIDPGATDSSQDVIDVSPENVDNPVDR